MSNPTVLHFGASRGVAFAGYASLAEQRPDLHHVLLIRSVSRFQLSEEYKSLPDDVRQRSTYFEGDAHNADNVRDVLKAAGNNIFAIVSSIGYTPPSTVGDMLRGVIKGFAPKPADICCRALTILVTELSKVYPTLSTKPKFILCSSMGMGKKAHAVLPFGLGAMYTLMLQPAHDDKIGMEVVMEKVTLPSLSGDAVPRFVPDPSEAPARILPPATYESLPAPFIPRQDICVMRPALMDDGVRKGWGAEKGGYRVIQEGPGPDETKGKKLYSISRKDCGDFIATMLAGKEEAKTAPWWGRQPVIGY